MPASLLGVHRWFIGALTVFMLSPGLSAQEVVDISLSLEEAIAIARQNNPGFQTTRNDEVTADWDDAQETVRFKLTAAERRGRPDA